MLTVAGTEALREQVIVRLELLFVLQAIRNGIMAAALLPLMQINVFLTFLAFAEKYLKIKMEMAKALETPTTQAVHPYLFHLFPPTIAHIPLPREQELTYLADFLLHNTELHFQEQASHSHQLIL
jgi:hypothetical protein